MPNKEKFKINFDVKNMDFSNILNNSTERIVIDIGAKSIKLLIGNKSKVKLWKELKTPENSFAEDKLKDTEAIAKVISGFLQDVKPKTKKLSFVIQSQDIITRTIETPIMEEAGIRKSVEWETSQYLPSAGENYYIDFEIIEKINEKNKKAYKVFVAATLREKIDSYVELSKKLDLELISIDISSNCIGRVFREVLKNDKDENIGIIDIGTSTSSIIILNKGRVSMERAVPFGVNNILREPSRLNDLNEMDLEGEFIVNLDMKNLNLEDEFERKINSLLNNVLSSFDRVIQFYNTGKVDKKLDKFYIIGIGSRIKGIEAYIERYFQVTTIKLQDFKELSIKTKFSDDFNFTSYINAFGILLRKE